MGSTTDRNPDNAVATGLLLPASGPRSEGPFLVSCCTEDFALAAEEIRTRSLSGPAADVLSVTASQARARNRRR
eukprot:12922747-Prorocentrum_lima.AAC.1